MYGPQSGRADGSLVFPFASWAFLDGASGEGEIGGGARLHEETGDVLGAFFLSVTATLAEGAATPGKCFAWVAGDMGLVRKNLRTRWFTKHFST